MCSRNMRKMPRNQRQEGSKNNTTHTHLKSTTHTPQKAAQSKRQHQASTSTSPLSPPATPSEIKKLKVFFMNLWRGDNTCKWLRQPATYRTCHISHLPHTATHVNYVIGMWQVVLNLWTCHQLQECLHILIHFFFSLKMFVLVRLTLRKALT